VAQSTSAAQSTIERVTQQAQALASQVSDQAGKAATALRPDRARKPARGRLGDLAASAGAAIPRPRVAATTRFAWRAGQVTGRIQGASAVAPLAARGWRLALTQRAEILTTRARLGAQARWQPVATAGTQIAGRMRPRTQPQQLWPVALPLLARNAASNGTRVAAKPPVRQPSAKEVAARRARTAQARQRAWRVAWMFAIGAAIGGAWAYFFAQRRGPGYEALRQRATETQS
jgi:hypothetical protein